MCTTAAREPTARGEPTTTRAHDHDGRAHEADAQDKVTEVNDTVFLYQTRARIRASLVVFFFEQLLRHGSQL